VDFSRLQFTPDLMPSDVIGTSIFNVKTSDFQFKPGPIFSNVVLIDEINRSPAKTQAALFEVMEERTVTVDGISHPMRPPFFVIATQNPIEQEGTYRLPEAQLDRFIFRIRIGYPTLEEEKKILRRFRDRPSLQQELDVEAVLDAETIQACLFAVDRVLISDALCDYVAEIVHHTRHSGSLYLGGSPRASLAIMRTAKAWAVLNGRSFVIPEDIQYMAYPVLNHRILLAPERELEGVDTEQVIKEILGEIEVPR
jgi:MoxR-like ATPase